MSDIKIIWGVLIILISMTPGLRATSPYSVEIVSKLRWFGGIYILCARSNALPLLMSVCDVWENNAEIASILKPVPWIVLSIQQINISLFQILVIRFSFIRSCVFKYIWSCNVGESIILFVYHPQILLVQQILWSVWLRISTIRLWAWGFYYVTADQDADRGNCHA